MLVIFYFIPVLAGILVYIVGWHQGYKKGFEAKAKEDSKKSDAVWKLTVGEH
ncbi:MAG: hypothetical protein WC178_00850 [Candidatus Paceibacterota bacterium]